MNSNFVKFSRHADTRLDSRLGGKLGGICTKTEVVNAVRAACPLGIGETAIFIKRLPQPLTLEDPYDGSVSRGDMVYAVYRRADAGDPGCVTMVGLRGRSQGPSSRWSRIVDLTA